LEPNVLNDGLPEIAHAPNLIRLVPFKASLFDECASQVFRHTLCR
jgi:hypothetical protein